MKAILLVLLLVLPAYGKESKRDCLQKVQKIIRKIGWRFGVKEPGNQVFTSSKEDGGYYDSEQEAKRILRVYAQRRRENREYREARTCLGELLK